MRWRWFGGALALVGAILIVASLFYGAESEAQSERTSSPSAAAVSSLAELRANNLLIRDYGEALKRAAGGGIPPLARTRAIQAAKALPALGGAGTWTFIGPDMITNGQGMSAVSSCNKVPRISVSGRVTALGFGKNPSTIYLGTALGGLWISTDSAGTWQPLLDQQPSMAVGALAVVPGAPDTIYVGTGEGNNGCDNEFGQGILKSTDGGASWEQLAADTFDRLTFTKLSVDPLDPNVLYAATSYGLADSQSNACSSVTTGRSGVYKSTDGGASWISRSGKGGLPNGGGASAFDGSAYDVAVNPAPTFAGPFSGIIFDSGGDSCQGAATPPGQATLTAFNPANLTDPNPFKIQVHPSPTGGYDITGTIQIKQDPPSGSFPAGCGTGTNPPCGICDDYGTTKGLPFDVPYQCNGHVKDLNGSPTDFFNCFGGSEVGSAPQMVLKGNFSGDAFNGTLEIDNIICDINCAQDFLGPEAVTFKLVPEVFAGIGGASGGLFKSTDAGITWTKAPTVSTGRRFAIDFSPDGGTMYVANTTLPNANNTSFFNAIYRSTDLGGTFASPGGSPTNACFPEQIGFYALALAVDPANAQHVYLGLSGLYSSNDGGKTFNFIGAGTHADQHVLKTVQGGKLYAGNDGGLFSSTDGGGTWAALNKGLGITQFYGIGLDSSATNITGGTQDNGTDSTTVGTLTWAHSDDGDGGFALIDQNDPTIYFDEHFNLSLDRSGNSGALGSYTPISPGGASMDPIQFYAPFTADPSNPERVLIGTNRLWESCHLQVIAPNFACNGATGLSPDWSAISNDLTGGCTNGFCDITDIAIAPANPQVLYVVTATDGTIGPLAWRSTSGTTIPASFTPITPAGLGKRALTSVAVSPVDAATVVVTAGGFTNTGTAAGHVFLSSDMGKSWSDIGATLTVTVPGGAVLPLDIPVETAAFDPDSPSAGLFIGTDIGVFHTADRGGSWTEVNLGMLPNVPVYQLRAAGGKLFAATHGRGVWSFAPAPTPTASASMTPTATPTATHTATPTPTHTATPSDTPTATPTETPTESPTETPSETATQTPEPTPTPVAAGPFISSIPSTILVGSSFVIDGSGFTNGSVINFFVATSNGPLNAGPLTPSNKTPTALTVVVPATITLGQGFVALQVVNTDQGFVSSNLANALLEGSPGAGIPSITSINGVGLASSSSNPSFATDNVETVVAQGTVVTIGGAGFDTTNGVAVDLFCACTGGKVGPFFISPGPSLSASQIKFTVPAKGLTNSPATGPGSFVVSNAGALKNYAKKSNAVSVPIGARISVLSVSQVASTITVHGTGFSTLTVINFFNKQGAMVVNLGGLSGSTPNIPLNVINDTTFQFNKPAGSVAGPAYVQALNPPFVQFTSSGNDPGGAFTLF